MSIIKDSMSFIKIAKSHMKEGLIACQVLMQMLLYSGMVNSHL